MDNNIKEVLNLRIKRTLDNLNRNGFEASYVQDKNALLSKLKKELRKNASIMIGGSVTLAETGVLELIQSSEYQFIDRAGQNFMTEEEKEDIKRRVFTSDVFFMSSNAITEDGKLYNVDGMGSRVAPLIFGPKEVYVIAGVNKIVGDLDEARKRVRQLSAPANSMRLHLPNPCAKTGHCMDCESEKRICCFEVVCDRQFIKNRIKVVIVGENYGY